MFCKWSHMCGAPVHADRAVMMMTRRRKRTKKRKRPRSLSKWPFWISPTSKPKGKPKPPRCFLVSSPCLFHGEVQVAESSSMDGTNTRLICCADCIAFYWDVGRLPSVVTFCIGRESRKPNRVYFIVYFAACSPMVCRLCDEMITNRLFSHDNSSHDMAISFLLPLSSCVVGSSCKGRSAWGCWCRNEISVQHLWYFENGDDFENRGNTRPQHTMGILGLYYTNVLTCLRYVYDHVSVCKMLIPAIRCGGQPRPPKIWPSYVCI